MQLCEGQKGKDHSRRLRHVWSGKHWVQKRWVRSVIRVLLYLQAGLILPMLALYVYRGLSLAVPLKWILPVGTGAVLILGCWAFYTFVRCVPAVSHSLLALILMVSLGFLCVSLSYVLVTFHLPFVDALLARGGAVLGAPVPIIVKWVQARPFLNTLSILVYNTLWPQVVVVILLLGLVLKDLRSLWECVFHFHFTVVCMLLVFAVTPALGAYVWYDFTSSVNQTYVLRTLLDLRYGGLRQIDIPPLIEGLISFPSFHTIAAVVIAYSLRRHPRWFWPFIGLDIMMVISTISTGAHYMVDLLAAFLICGISFWVFERWFANKMLRSRFGLATRAAS